MKNTRHRVAAALIAACFATTAYADGAPAPSDVPAAGVDAPAVGAPGAPGDPDGPGAPGGPGAPEMDGGPHGFGAHGPGMPGPDMPPGGRMGGPLEGPMEGPMGGFHGAPGMDGPHDGMMGRFHHMDLSEAQQDKLFAIMHAAAPERREHAKAIRKAHEALAELGRADRFDDARATALSRELGQAIAAEALLRARTEAQSLAVLTPEQRDQLRRHRSKGPQVRPGQPGQTSQPGQQGAPGKQ